MLHNARNVSHSILSLLEIQSFNQEVEQVDTLQACVICYFEGNSEVPNLFNWNEDIDHLRMRKSVIFDH